MSKIEIEKIVSCIKQTFPAIEAKEYLTVNETEEFINYIYCFYNRRLNIDQCTEQNIKICKTEDEKKGETIKWKIIEDITDKDWSIQNIEEIPSLILLKGSEKGQYNYDISSSTQTNKTTGDKFNIVSKTSQSVIGDSWIWFYGRKFFFFKEYNVRFFFNLRFNKEKIEVFINELVNQFNFKQIPFQFKIQLYESSFNRADCAVLYVYQKHYYVVLYIIKYLYDKHADIFNELTPLFTRKLSGGLAFSEHPTNGDSFGKARANLLFSKVFDKSIRSIEGIIESISKEGYDIDSFYKNAHSKFEYDFGIFDNKQRKIAQPSIIDFKYESPLLMASAKAAYILCKEGIIINNEVIWIGYDDNNDNKNNGYKQIDISLDKGIAGVAFFLTHLYKLYNDSLFIDIIERIFNRLERILEAEVKNNQFDKTSVWEGVLFATEKISIVLTEFVERHKKLEELLNPKIEKKGLKGLVNTQSSFFQKLSPASIVTFPGDNYYQIVIKKGDNFTINESAINEAIRKLNEGEPHTSFSQDQFSPNLSKGYATVGLVLLKLYNSESIPAIPSHLYVPWLEVDKESQS